MTIGSWKTWLLALKVWALVAHLLCAQVRGQVIEPAQCPGGVCPQPGLWGQARVPGYQPQNPKAPRGVDYAPSDNYRAPLADAPHQEPRPAIVKVVAFDRGGGNSIGSGSLVAVSADGAAEKLGLIITNNHVVSDAGQRIDVVFSDGQRYGAKLLGVDPTWDLAALLIIAPAIKPLPLAAANAVRGERVTVTGYAGGRTYSEATGTITAFGRPAGAPRASFESLKISVPRAGGCSGAPVLNARGELVGVLWGSDPGEGTTTATCCLRLRKFLARFANRFGSRQAAPPDMQPGPVDEGQATPQPFPDTGSLPPSDRTGDSASDEGGPLAKIKSRLDKLRADHDKLKAELTDLKLKPPRPDAPDAPLWEGRPIGEALAKFRTDIAEHGGAITAIDDRIRDIAANHPGIANAQLILEKLKPLEALAGNVLDKPEVEKIAGDAAMALLIKLGLPTGGATLAIAGLWGLTRLIKKRRGGPPTQPPLFIPPAWTSDQARPTLPPSGPPAAAMTPAPIITEYHMNDGYARALAEKRQYEGKSMPQQALIGQLYGEAVKALGDGKINFLGAQDAAARIENWVQAQFMQRHGSQPVTAQ